MKPKPLNYETCALYLFACFASCCTVTHGTCPKTDYSDDRYTKGREKVQHPIVLYRFSTTLTHGSSINKWLKIFEFHLVELEIGAALMVLIVLL